MPSFFELMEGGNTLMWNLPEAEDLLQTYLYVILLQYFRTKRQKANIEAYAEHFDDPSFARTWQVHAFIMAKRVSMHLFRRRRTHQLVLIHNHTIMPFITGDQPVVNVHASRMITRNTEGLEFYYPISPRLAVMIIKGSWAQDRIWHVQHVGKIRGLNQLIVDHALEDLYGDRPGVLEMYSPFVGFRL